MKQQARSDVQKAVLQARARDRRDARSTYDIRPDSPPREDEEACMSGTSAFARGRLDLSSSPKDACAIAGTSSRHKLTSVQTGILLSAPCLLLCQGHFRQQTSGERAGLPDSPTSFKDSRPDPENSKATQKSAELSCALCVHQLTYVAGGNNLKRRETVSLRSKAAPLHSCAGRVARWRRPSKLLGTKQQSCQPIVEPSGTPDHFGPSQSCHFNSNLASATHFKLATVC